MNVLKPHLQTTIWTLLRAGNTQREIERRTGISRHTIRAWAKRFEAQGDPPPPSPDDSNCPGVAADLVVPLASQTAPPRPPTDLSVSPAVAISKCEPHRSFIDAQLLLIARTQDITQSIYDRCLSGIVLAHESSQPRLERQLERLISRPERAEVLDEKLCNVHVTPPEFL